ncbi:hypothetical protein S1OALGB6SA_2104 [Olavius algarvensis spirochete endosymbiont]|uniref:MBL fold metallo-hydrolase n=1 Tax=Olavius algarvensis spirochete endosymbiont TaxID=260710 RepID=UPI000F0E7976|nr:MBL fold metallo-hydrolase [Olavius algarvensis spirochete endosymbiont]CAD7844778.1 MAG: hypothetical protein [Olavius algarvensis spirochete endosymbiont]VDB01010.1 hypothetical protein S1OALGB6SA_2104 [Olavius algarvensis spirochete endosymbiont]
MKLLSYFSGTSNSYIIGQDDGGEAILVDPDKLDVVLLGLIEANNFDITTALVTHSHERYIRGLRILKRVYNIRIISGYEEIGDFKSEFAGVGDRIEASGIGIETLNLEEWLAEGRIFRIGNLLFTGNILSAGYIEDSIPPEKRTLLIDDIQKKIMAISEELLILPSCGPPSTISAELRWNPCFQPQRQTCAVKPNTLL